MNPIDLFARLRGPGRWPSQQLGGSGSLADGNAGCQVSTEGARVAAPASARGTGDGTRAGRQRTRARLAEQLREYANSTGDRLSALGRFGRGRALAPAGAGAFVLSSAGAQRRTESEVGAPAASDAHIVNWTVVPAEYPRGKGVHELFEEAAAAHPGAVAVVDGPRCLTYAELQCQVHAMSQRLRSAGVGRGAHVALLMARSLELVVAELAVVACGAAYVPLDDSAPAERQAFQIADSQAAVVLIAGESRVPAGVAVAVLRVDETDLERANASCQCVPSMSEEAAYLMYTSGSSGLPKGVAVPHRAISSLLWKNSFLQLEASDRVAFVANPAFDPSTLEVWGPLLHGGCIVVVDAATARDPEALKQVLLKQRITVLNLTSGVFNQYADVLASAFPQLRCLLLGGDVVDPRLVARVLKWNAPEHLVYTYGPTETTLYATAWDVREVAEAAGSLPIGQPIANASAHILNAAGSPVRVGETGELHIGGVGVSLGYFGRPELTAERFVPDRFGGVPGARLYQTGDLARWTENTQIEFRGRSDRQVKIRGFRIELGEIEARLSTHPGVSEVAVEARQTAHGDKSLVAYYTARETGCGEPMDPAALRRHLAATLPEYMVPAAYVRMAQLPLTANGKVDRRALPAPGAGSYVTVDYQAPRGEVEQTLARLWADLLDVERVGRHDNFFELGGDSIRVIKLLWRLRSRGLALEPQQVMEHPTLEKLAAQLGQFKEGNAEQGLLAGNVPLTAAQQRFFASGFPNLHHFNQAQIFQLGSRPNLELLRTIFSALERQHDVLRTRFQRAGADWVQAYGPVSELPSVDGVDASAIEETCVAEWMRATGNEVQRALDIQSGPVYRARWVQLHDRDVLLIVVHHLAVDGVSWRIIADDLNHLLSQARSGQPLRLGRKTSSFRQWSGGLLEYSRGTEILAELRDHWHRLAAMDASSAPLEVASPPPGSALRLAAFQLSEAETSRFLTVLPRASRAHVNELLLVALGRALRAVWGAARWRIQLEGHGREQELVAGSDLSRTIGWFTADFPFVIDVSADLLPDAVAKVRADLRAVPHKGVSYGVLRFLRSELREEDRVLLQQLESRISFNYLGQMGSDLRHDELSSLSLPTGETAAAANVGPWLLEVVSYVDEVGRLQMQVHHPESLSAPVSRLVLAFRDQLRELDECNQWQAADLSRQPLLDAASGMLARKAEPRDYAAVRDICIATFSGASRWVAQRLAAPTWLDPLWASDRSAKFVLEVEGRVVGYLIGARDLDSFDFRGLRATSRHAPALICQGVHAWATRRIAREELAELVEQLKMYGLYTWWRSRSWAQTWLNESPRRRNVNFHFNILSEYGASGGMLALIGMWENWLRNQGEAFAFLNVGTFHGLEDNRALQQQLARGLGYQHGPPGSPLWVKQLFPRVPADEARA